MTLARTDGPGPELEDFLTTSPVGDTTIDFSNPGAVRALNRALLKVDYGVAHWNIPDGYLCPPIPGRADYVHGLADLLAECNGGVVPRGPAIRVLDVGVGANCIYPLVGHSEYGWRFVGFGGRCDRAAVGECDRAGESRARRCDRVSAQSNRGQVFEGVVHEDERFDLTLSIARSMHPPRTAARGSRRKSRNLGTPMQHSISGARPSELWCTAARRRSCGACSRECRNQVAGVVVQQSGVETNTSPMCTGS